MGEIQRFDFEKANAASINITKYANEMKKIQGRILLMIKSVSWWAGDSKNGYLTRTEPILQKMAAALDNAVLLGSDMKYISQQKEKEERDLANALRDGVTMKKATPGSGGGSGSGSGSPITASVYASTLGYEFADDHPGVTAYLGKVGAEVQGEYGSAGVNVYLGKVTAETEAGFSFMSYETEMKLVDGEWKETQTLSFINAEASAGISISVLAADIEANVGSDMLGVGVEAEGSAGNASAEVGGKFSISESGINTYVEGEAMISAVEGRASMSFNILGIEITGNVGGYAGALGVEGKIGIEDNKFVMEGGIAALFGASAGIEIGFNGTGLDNFVDFIKFW